MNAYTAIEKLPIEVKKIDEHFTSITITLPSCQLNGFLLLLQSLSELFRFISWKNKINPITIEHHNQKQKEDSSKILEAYEKDICKTFKYHVNNSLTPREALSLTVSGLSAVYPFSSYDNVKNVLSKNKMLKNSGFYSKKSPYNNNL